MVSNHATIVEIQQNLDGTRQAVIHWPGGKKLLPGQYLQAFNLAEQNPSAAESIFLGGLPDPDQDPHIWTTAPSIPLSWNPADQLILRGPIGNGFTIPEKANRIALAAFGAFACHLLPVVGGSLKFGGEVALFTDSPFPQLPASIEVNPLNALADGVRWAEYVAGCTSIEKLPETRSILRQAEADTNTEILILSPMPCGALAGCGVCASKTGGGKTFLVCEDGPVIPWKTLSRG